MLLSLRPPVTVFQALAHALLKEGGAPYRLTGMLQIAPDNTLYLGVPNPLVRGIFGAMSEPGIELPDGPGGGDFNAHIPVMEPDEVDQIGGPDVISERGKRFEYTLGAPETMDSPLDGLSKAWVLRIHSPALKTLRRTYGLPPTPDGEGDFALVVAVRRTHVLGANPVSKLPRA